MSCCDAHDIGAVNRKYVMQIAQRNEALALQWFEADLMKVSMVMKSKQSQCDSHVEIVKLHITLGEKDVKKEVALAKEAMLEITVIEATAMELGKNVATQKMDGDVASISGTNVESNVSRDDTHDD